MKKASEVGANVAEPNSSQGNPNRSVQEMALANYIIVRQIICYLSYLDTVNLCEASEDIMKMVGSKISYFVISLSIHPFPDIRIPPGCTCEMFSANVEERTIGYKKTYKISLVNLLDHLKKSGRENFKLSMRIFIPDLSMDFMQNHGEHLISFFTEFGLNVEQFDCMILYEQDEQQFQYFIRCLQIFQNLRVLRFACYVFPIPLTFPEVPICLSKLTTINIRCGKARTDFLLSIAPNLQKIFDFPMDQLSLISKYNAETKVKTVVRTKNFEDNDAFFEGLANAGVKLESPLLNFERVWYKGQILNDTNFPERIFGPKISGSTVKRLAFWPKYIENANYVFPHLNHVKLHGIELQELTTTFHKLNCMWPKLTSVTVHTRPHLTHASLPYKDCPSCASSIDSIITGISDETLKSISNDVDSGGEIEPEGAGTSILFQMKNLRSLTLHVPFCHFFSKWGQKRNLTAASINYALKKLPNLKVFILVDLSIKDHWCWDVHKLYEEFKQELQPFAAHIYVDTYLPQLH